jgi:hypothetical protein
VPKTQGIRSIECTIQCFETHWRIESLLHWAYCKRRLTHSF